MNLIWKPDTKLWVPTDLSRKRPHERGSVGIMAQRMPLKPQSGKVPFTVDAEAASHTPGFIDPWTDGAFPANVQPAPLWNTGITVFVVVSFSVTGLWTITIDGGTNFNIGSIAMWNQDTATSITGPVGSLNSAVSFNSGSPGALYAAAMGTITANGTGNRKIWFSLTLQTYATIKNVHGS